MEILDVLVSWDASMPAPQNPSKMANIFKSQGITHDQAKAHVDFVWKMTTYGGEANKTPNYFKNLEWSQQTWLHQGIRGG
eukprot:2572462-Ditylum_brightwellii.AAC.1